MGLTLRPISETESNSDRTGPTVATSLVILRTGDAEAVMCDPVIQMRQLLKSRRCVTVRRLYLKATQHCLPAQAAESGNCDRKAGLLIRRQPLDCDST